MANKTLFAATLRPATAIGCLSNTFYAGAEEQLETVLKLAL